METRKEDCASSKHVELYKFTNAKDKSTQEDRRKQFLENVRLKRRQVANQNRNMYEATEDVYDFKEVENMDTSGPSENKKALYANKLMFSEWITEIPSDLEEKWLVKLCPVGQRRLVVAKNRETIVYNKHGTKKDQFLSKLPGAYKKSSDSKITILDCIYNHQVHCYFVLDVLVWNGKCVSESDTDFRFFFIKSKLNEMPELRTTDKYNHRKFVEIEEFCATRELIEEKMTHLHKVNDKTVLLDGLLFYHKEAPYEKGTNPLVGWLKPHMLPNLLNVTVPDYYLEEETRKVLKTNRKNRNFKAEDLLCDMMKNMEID